MKTRIRIYFACRKISISLILLLFVQGVAFSQANAPLKFGNSYVNLTKKTVGGTVEPGDTLEIRTNIYANTSYGKIYSVRYLDNLPTHTDTISSEFLRLINNEGMTCRQYTLASGDDPGTFIKVPAFPGDYQVRINMGGPAFGILPTAPSGLDFMSVGNKVGASDMKPGTNRPLANGGTLVVTSFRVRVTGNYGDTIVLGAGVIAYQNSSGVDTTCKAIQYKILIAKPATLCASSTGTNFAAESGGTFDHGVGRNRSYGPTFLIPNYTYLPASSTASVIGDGYYAIVNNISPTSSTFPGARRTPNCSVPSAIPNTDPNSCNNREFGGFWFISGDHTGTTTAAGNPPPDSTTDAGYMLLVNADLATSEAYRQTISGLCPNTYYQFSAWIKNVCPNCGIDTNAVATHLPGVLPTLTFVVDGLDRYSSGQMDTVGWQKKGFVLLTGPTQTSITISIRNNAPGGGGNDWAMDDIALATCPPDLLLTPNKPDTLCQGADDTVRFKVASYVDNYTQWMLQQSTDGGVTWALVGNDTAGRAGSGSVVPVYNAVTGQYIDTVTRYFRLNPVNSLIIYRIVVATTVANLTTSGCSFATNTPKIVHAINCNVALPTTLISFRGQVREGLGALQWVSADETADVGYIVERSDDGSNFTPIGFVKGLAGAGQGTTYHFTDPTALAPQSYYRINITGGNFHRYSNQVLLGTSGINFEVRSAVNPFTDHITMDLTTPGDGTVLISLTDMVGRLVRREKAPVSQGLNGLSLYGLGNLSNGTYVLQIQYADKMISKKMVKFSK
jgi:hypothetical protein